MQGITPTKMGPTPIRTKCYYDILSYMGFEKHPSHMQNSLDSQIECELSSFTGKGQKKKKKEQTGGEPGLIQPQTINCLCKIFDNRSSPLAYF